MNCFALNNILIFGVYSHKQESFYIEEKCDSTVTMKVYLLAKRHVAADRLKTAAPLISLVRDLMYVINATPLTQLDERERAPQFT